MLAQFLSHCRDCAPCYGWFHNPWYHLIVIIPHTFSPTTSMIWLLILPSSCYIFPCKLVTRIWCQIKITTLAWHVCWIMFRYCWVFPLPKISTKTKVGTILDCISFQISFTIIYRQPSKNCTSEHKKETKPCAHIRVFLHLIISSKRH